MGIIRLAGLGGDLVYPGILRLSDLVYAEKRGAGPQGRLVLAGGGAAAGTELQPMDQQRPGSTDRFAVILQCRVLDPVCHRTADPGQNQRSAFIGRL